LPKGLAYICLTKSALRGIVFFMSQKVIAIFLIIHWLLPVLGQVRHDNPSAESPVGQKLIASVQSRDAVGLLAPKIELPALSNSGQAGAFSDRSIRNLLEWQDYRSKPAYNGSKLYKRTHAYLI
jgi:hypothetical protein